MSLFRFTRLCNLSVTHFCPLFVIANKFSTGDEFGRGAGKGGGSGGAIRDAGGSFGKKQAANEEDYFRRQAAKQLKELKEHLDDEIEHHEEEIHRHMEAIKRHRTRMREIKDDNGSDSEVDKKP